ncbi:MAG: molecular chaperone HtpG [Mogibacterium sp.]|nr:molecular chaperone HtpG [Mogibacterium sp.]
MSRKKQFKAESKRLLDLMINSIYTHREIFLREIISNASDAIDKRYYKEAVSGRTGLSREDFEIRISVDEAARQLKISDNGIGMTKEELEENLGVIAKSGSLNFKAENAEAAAETDIIGQFGVGFYSAFMVAKKIEVLSLAFGETQAHLWTSEGIDGFTVEEAEKAEAGTVITLTLRDDTEEEKYSEFLNEYKIRSLVRKYSDYIRYPIVMLVSKSREIEVSDEEREAEDYRPSYETYYEDERLNSMVPIWKKKKSEITAEEYNEFYKNKFFDWNDPLKVIHTNVEGILSYDALLYIPGQVPFNYYTKDFKKGLQLYSSGVMIMEHCEDLLPDYFAFIKGLVDSQDLSLNISREILQQDCQLKAIAQRLEKKISQTLSEMQEKEWDDYKKFFENFGMQLKFGLYDGYGQNADKLKDLVIWYSGTTEDMTTFKDYVSRMPEDQKFIYYACGDSREKIAKMPQMDLFKEKGYEVLYCTDDIDEFALKTLNRYEDKPFKNISDRDLGFEQSDEEKQAQEQKAEEAKDVLGAVKEALGDAVSAVILSTRLKDHPVCFASGEGLSLEMEKILKAQAEMTGNKEMSGIKADKILELNGEHSFFAALKAAVENEDKEKVEDYSKLLYDQALIIEGMPVEDPVAFSNRICKLMK